MTRARVLRQLVLMVYRLLVLALLALVLLGAHMAASLLSRRLGPNLVEASGAMARADGCAHTHTNTHTSCGPPPKKKKKLWLVCALCASALSTRVECLRGHSKRGCVSLLVPPSAARYLLLRSITYVGCAVGLWGGQGAGAEI